MPRLAVVTGANGSVGSNLIGELLQNGYAVRGLVRRGADRTLLEERDCELVEVNYRNVGQLVRACQGASCVFHLVALLGEFGAYDEFHTTNVGITESIAQAALAARVPRLLYVSSAVVYGCSSRRDLCELDVSDDLPFPYSKTKRLAEQHLLSLKGIEVVIVRAGDVLGPRDRVATPPFLDRVRSGWFPVVGTGQALLCYTYIGNLVRGIRLASERGGSGQVYNISDGIELELRDYVKLLASAMGRTTRLLHIPFFIAYPAAAVSETLSRWFRVAHPFLTRYRVMRAARSCHMSITKAQRELGYSPELDLDAQIRAQVNWYQEYRKRRRKT